MRATARLSLVASNAEGLESQPPAANHSTHEFLVVPRIPREKPVSPAAEKTALNGMNAELIKLNETLTTRTDLCRAVLQLGKDVLESYVREYGERSLYAKMTPRKLLADIQCLLGERPTEPDAFLPGIFDSVANKIDALSDHGVAGLDRKQLHDVLANLQVAAIHLVIKTHAKQWDGNTIGSAPFMSSLEPAFSKNDSILGEAVTSAANLNEPAYPYRTASQVFSRAMQLARCGATEG